MVSPAEKTELVERYKKAMRGAHERATEAWELLGTKRDCLVCRKEFIFEQAELIDFDRSIELADELREIALIPLTQDPDNEKAQEAANKYMKEKDYKACVRSFWEMTRSIEGQAHMVLLASSCDPCSWELMGKRHHKKALARRKEILPKDFHLKVVK